MPLLLLEEVECICSLSWHTLKCMLRKYDRIFLATSSNIFNVFNEHKKDQDEKFQNVPAFSACRVSSLMNVSLQSRTAQPEGIWALLRIPVAFSRWWGMNVGIGSEKCFRIMCILSCKYWLIEGKNATTRACKAALDTICKCSLELFNLSKTKLGSVPYTPCTGCTVGKLTLLVIGKYICVIYLRDESGCTCANVLSWDVL